MARVRGLRCGIFHRLISESKFRCGPQARLQPALFLEQRHKLLRIAGTGRHCRQFFQSLAYRAKPVLQFRLSAVRHSEVGPRKEAAAPLQESSLGRVGGERYDGNEQPGRRVTRPIQVSRQRARRLRPSPSPHDFVPRSQRWLLPRGVIDVTFACDYACCPSVPAPVRWGQVEVVLGCPKLCFLCPLNY